MSRSRAFAPTVVSGAALAITLVFSAGGCGDSSPQAGVADGASARGLDAFYSSGCAMCHGDGSGRGPSLAGIGHVYLTEALGDRQKARDMLLAYIKDPKGV